MKKVLCAGNVVLVRVCVLDSDSLRVVGEHLSYCAAAWLEFAFGSIYGYRAYLSEDDHLFGLRFLFVP